MGVISMWIVKNMYKKKLKQVIKDNPNTSPLSLLSTTTDGDLKKLRTKIRIMNVIISIILFITLATGIVATSVLTSTSHTAMAVAANAILSILDDDKKKAEEEEEEGWSWEKHDGDSKGDEQGGSSGGMYPKDRGLKLRAQLIEMTKKSCEDTNAYKGTNVYYTHIIGVMLKETQDAFFSDIDSLNTQDLYSELVLPNPACGRYHYGASCSYMNRGISHFYNGSTSGKYDSGDPYTQVINTNTAYYDGDHAVSYGQLEIPYIYDPKAEFYMNYGSFDAVTSSSDSATAQSEVSIDPNLGFIRPNPFYMPDLMWNLSAYVANYYGDKGNTLAGYSSLSDYNKSCVDFLIAMSYYSGGGLSYRKEMIEQVIAKVNNGEVENIDDLGLSLADKYWDKENNRVIGPGIKQFGKDFERVTGINPGSVGKYREIVNGMFALFLGRVACEDMQADIDAAEKDGPVGGAGGGASDGNWLDHPGSGRFGNDNSPYYVDELGVRFYSQTRENPAYGDKWWNIALNGWSDTYGRPATLETGGCGIYTVAMVASNLLNKDITPDVVRGMLQADMVGNCLYDTGVDYALTQLGLTHKKLNYTSADAIDKVNEELKKGNLIIFVSARGPSPWYGGAGHFMALRGIDDSGNYLSLNSAGNARNGRDPIDLMGVAVSPDSWKASLSPVRNYVWVVGVNV